MIIIGGQTGNNLKTGIVQGRLDLFMIRDLPREVLEKIQMKPWRS